uniref:Uncharacterized protein K0031E03.42 n=1 Tax=Oryza sativa subsp. indica TaxID=39946 RepID=C8TEY2_ORYSI|nr:hypothetical protein [Oryza sativa Indica Group]BAI39902.1 hypothetical protein [Oryza sativa Indica Group]
MNAGPPAASLPLDPVEGKTPPPGRHCLPSPSAISGTPDLAHRVAAASSPAGSDGGEGTAAAVTPGYHRLPSPPVGSGTSVEGRAPPVPAASPPAVREGATHHRQAPAGSLVEGGRAEKERMREGALAEEID